ncbi:MAG TPA: alpha/beta hydrolase [Usitatibacter sp.]|nr:alpha/beta hydrolase [Usitatibacter sp.]
MAATPLFFLPGLLEDAQAFAAQIEALGETAACSVADLTASDSIAALAAEALRQAPRGSFCLAGHSMGGYVALEIMRTAPQRVERLALLNTHARPDSEEATANRRRLMALAEKDFPAVIEALMPKLMTAEHQQDLGLRGTITEMALGVGKEGFARQETAIIGRIDSRPHLAAIRCPTLVVAARHDQLMPVEILQELASGIPRARLEIVEDSGHMSTLEQAGKVADLLESWLTR